MGFTKLFDYSVPGLQPNEGMAAVRLNGVPYMCTTTSIYELNAQTQSLTLVAGTGLTVPTDTRFRGVAAFVDGNCIVVLVADGQRSRICFGGADGTQPTSETSTITIPGESGTMVRGFKHTYDANVTFGHFLNLEDSAYSGSTPTHELYIKGKKLPVIEFDGANYSISEEKVFTVNAINVLLDYLIAEHYGPGSQVGGTALTADDIDLESFYNAQEVGNQLLSGSLTFDNAPNQIERFMSDASDSDITDKMLIYGAYNGTLTTEKDFFPAIDSILDAFPGALFFKRLDENGKYAVAVVDPTVSTVTSVATITDNDIVGDIEIETPDTNRLRNRITMQFKDIENDYKGTTLEVPSRGSSLRTQLDAEDDSILRLSINAPYINNKIHATMHAIHEIAKRHRELLSVVVRSKHIGLELGDVISINTNTLDLSNKQYRIIGIESDTANLTFTLQCIEFIQTDYVPYTTDNTTITL